MTLDELRVKIDNIDDALLKLYNERMELVHQVGEVKNTTGAPIYRPEREQAILNRLKSQNKGKAHRCCDRCTLFGNVRCSQKS